MFDLANVFLYVLWTHNKILGQVMWGPKQLYPKELVSIWYKGFTRTTELKVKSSKF